MLNPDETGLGEIATRGRNACMGYLWEEGKTAELIDAEGYILSGDLGRFDKDGFLFVSGKIVKPVTFKTHHNEFLEKADSSF